MGKVKHIGKIKSDDISYNGYGFKISKIDEDCVLPKTFVGDITEITGTGEIDYYYGLNWSTKERVEWSVENKKKLLLQFQMYAKRLGGRPPIEEKEKRNKKKTICFTEREYEKLKTEAEKTRSKDFNAYLRARILDKKITILTEDKNLSKLLFQLAKIGNNINQIAHFFNIKKEENPSMNNEQIIILNDIKSLLMDIAINLKSEREKGINNTLSTEKRKQ